jgi:predicted CXXCH cytochrome family protein
MNWIFSTRAKESRPGQAGFFKYFLSLLSISWILVSGSLWAAPPFDEVVKTPHNLLPARGLVGFKNVCLICHADEQVLKEGEADRGEESAVPRGEGSNEGTVPGRSMQESLAGPLWSPGSKDQTFTLISSLWTLQSTVERKPFGSSSACLGCHDGALAKDVHEEQKGLDGTRMTRGRPLDHPTSIPYPRLPNGIFATERPTPGSQRYWSIADRTGEGITMPSGPVSDLFKIPDGVDPKDPSVVALAVRTSYGIVHCDSCHNPHINQYPPFLRTPPRDLCFVCHDR